MAKFKLMKHKGYTLPYPNVEEMKRRGVKPHNNMGYCGNCGCSGMTRQEVGCDTCLFGFLDEDGREVYAKWNKGNTKSRQLFREAEEKARG